MVLPTYFLIISLTICFCLWWLWRRALKRGYDVRLVMDVAIVSLIAGFVGARLFHVIYEYPSLYQNEPWRVLDFGRGGYVYYGGLIAGMITGWLYLRLRKIREPGKYFDLCAPLFAVGYALGRLACLLGGCCYGPICDWPWAILISDEAQVLRYRHPTPLYASLIEALWLMILLYVEKHPSWRKKLGFSFSGGLFTFWLALHSISRFFLEFWRDDFRGPIFIFSVSGWLSLALLCFAGWITFKNSKS